jgi:two-component system, OmpR family, sensor histidine kinase ChvG
MTAEPLDAADYSRARNDAGTAAAKKAEAERQARRLALRRRAGWRFWRSPIVRRVLLVNLIVLAVPVLGLLYLRQYEESLIRSELDAMATQGRVFALALGTSAVLTDQSGRERLVPELTRHLIRLLLNETGLRVRLYAPLEDKGELLVDSFLLAGPDGVIEVEELEPKADPGWLDNILDFIASLFLWLPGADALPPYVEGESKTAADFPEATAALEGTPQGQARRDAEGGLVLMQAVPVQRFRQVLGALMLSKSGAEIETAVAQRRIDVLFVFAVAMTVTVLLSLYLAGTIARPIRSLARAADQVKSGKGKKIALPDYSRRRDEIGELGRALTAMTDALWARLDAIEGFAADVAHEIKNPLTSLKSAVETVARLEDPARIKQLLAIVLDDVHRLDRLITDISDASRVDAELARAEAAPVDLKRLLEALVEVHRVGAPEGGLRFLLDLPADELNVLGLEGRLGQVFRNVIVNAISFSPPGGTITVAARRRGEEEIEVTIEDEGPGLPADKLSQIFDRFYSERPEGEKFGTHSGLGLSISRQIVEAHRGRIRAENRGSGTGARFVVTLPALPRPAEPRPATRGATRGRRP